MTCQPVIKDPGPPITDIHRGTPGTNEVGDTTTVDDGEPVLIVNVGTAFNARYNFQFPKTKGNPGDRGPQGPPGDLTTAMLLLGGM